MNASCPTVIIGHPSYEDVKHKGVKREEKGEMPRMADDIPLLTKGEEGRFYDLSLSAQQYPLHAKR